MLLKIDHISFSCDSAFDFNKQFADTYYEEFRELNLPNITCKERFLKLKSPQHNIYMYKDTCGGIPIEVTQYPKVTSDISCMKFEKRNIYWPVFDIDSAKDFFLSVGGVCEDEKVVFKPFLDKESFTISFIKTEKMEEAFLDVTGFSSIGLFVDNIQKYVEKIGKCGYKISNISQIDIQGKKMDIAFTSGSNGEIIELISLAKVVRG